MNIIPYLRQEPIPLRILAGPFRGTHLILNPACSKRKILGIYEHILNPWLNQIIPDIEVLFDVGANDGYFTYGCAKALKRYHKLGHIIAFEPGLCEQSALLIPATWSDYTNITFEFIPLFVGSISNESTITLDKAYEERPSLHGKPLLIKVDVEGSEVDVLEGATGLLQKPHHWVVEVHGDHLLDPVLDFFTKAKRAVDIRLLQPHWLLGSESRTIKTSWVTTRPDKANV
ncbi:FkbM family methyltransferase [Coleofasciculus sp. F4-SAH-05]|uniref:FkbM family methyltransferase n=1 Tax=Coleofasciculus sp. F4-SAH-05 TaxID=3069525 RepID=UPI0032F571B5